MKKRLSIKNKLVMYLGLILAIGFIVCGFVVNKIYTNMIEESALKSLARLATDTADKINIILSEKQKEIEKLAAVSALADEEVSIEEKLSLITMFNKLLDFKDIVLVDLDGNSYGVNGLRSNIADSVAFEEVLKGKVSISTAVEGENEMLFNIVAPLISRNGQVIGAVIGIESTESFTYILAEAGMSDEFIILDSNSSIVAHSDKEVLNDDKIVDEMKVLQEFKDVYYAPTNIGWSIGVGSSRNEVLNTSQKFNVGLVTVIAFIIVIGLIAVYFVAGQMANRVNEITNYLDTVAQGDFEQPIPKNLLELEDEMGDAARALEGMKSEIEKMIGTIKDCTDYMNDQIEDLTDSIKDELKNLLTSNEIDNKERKDVIERLDILNQIVQGIHQLDAHALHHSESTSKNYQKYDKINDKL